MKISEIKRKLTNLEKVEFMLPNGQFVPIHFHVTEVGIITKHFIDCGGKIRTEKIANFQLWEANDYDHRLSAEKLVKIIELSEQKLGLEDLEIEVEYQTETIGKYNLDFDGSTFLLVAKNTACLAQDSCGIPKEKIKLAELVTENTSCCSPSSGCCN